MPDRPVAVIVGATSKWQSGEDAQSLPLTTRWGLGGALALRFAMSGFQLALTTRCKENAAGLAAAVEEQGAACLVVEMELSSAGSVADAFNTIREQAGEPEVLIYNAGYRAARDLPPGKELLEYVPLEDFDLTQTLCCRGPFLVVNQVLPAMRERGSGAIFFSNNSSCLRGRKRKTGESLYYPRTQLRALAQVLTEEYSEHGIHVANVIVDGEIDSPGTRALRKERDGLPPLIDPAGIADAYHYLYTQDPSCWSHEIQLTPAASLQT